MTDKAGRNFECVLPTLRSEPLESPEAEKADADTSQKAIAAPDAAQPPPPPLPSLDSFLSPLAGRCFLRNEGYWNVELCHRRTVRQFHEEGGHTAVEYSLGNYRSTTEAAPKEDGSGTVGDLVVKHAFEGGTRCDETSGPRHTTVRYRCAPGKENQIESLKEDAVCSYTLVFITPLLCNHPWLIAAAGGAGGGKPGALAGPKGGAREFLSSLEGSCFYRVEGWWTYELCYGKALRQFHAENNVHTAEFVLGAYSSVTAHDPDIIEVDESTKDGGTYYVQHYIDGTKCDVTGEPRQVEVRFYCAADSLNLLASIKEKSTCKYIATFYTPAICNHPSFQVAADPARAIECFPARA